MKEEIVKQALADFTRYGFKTFTMDDLAHKLGISKKTLYEIFPSKNDLVEATLDYALSMTCARIETFAEGDGSVIENVFANQRYVREVFNINTTRPIWELQKYYPKVSNRMEEEFAKADSLFIDKILEKGWNEGLLRKDVNVKFYKRFYTGVQRFKAQAEMFPEVEYPFWEIMYTFLEYFFRILVNEKGLKELERVLAKIKGEYLTPNT